MDTEFHIGDRVRIIGNALSDIGTVLEVDPNHLRVHFDAYDGFGERESYLPKDILEPESETKSSSD
jgi:hypothetical protein